MTQFVFSSIYYTVVLATVLHQILAENASHTQSPIKVSKNATAKKHTTSPPASISSSMPNLLTTDGQIQLFPYNPNELSAKSELLHIMGRSAIANLNNTNTTLPIFPKGLQSYSQFSVPTFVNGTAQRRMYDKLYFIDFKLILG